MLELRINSCSVCLYTRTNTCTIYHFQPDPKLIYLGWRSANFSLKKPGSKYFRLGDCAVSVTATQNCLLVQNQHGCYVNKEQWLCTERLRTLTFDLHGRDSSFTGFQLCNKWRNNFYLVRESYKIAELDLALGHSLPNSWHKTFLKIPVNEIISFFMTLSFPNSCRDQFPPFCVCFILMWLLWLFSR